MTGDADQMLLRAGAPVSPSTRLAAVARFLPTPARTPFTFGYLVVLLGTTLLLKFGDPVLTDGLLTLSSTDAHNLWHRPLTSLLTSALWLADEGWVVYVVIFAVAVAPLERRIGARRTATVFFSGHVLATLATEVPIMVLISTHVLPSSSGRWLDIGVSYGFFTTAGALVFLLRGRAKFLASAAMELFIVVIWISDAPTSLESVLTLLGHACAAHIGLLFWGPRLHGRDQPPTPTAPTRELVAAG